MRKTIYSILAASLLAASCSLLDVEPAVICSETFYSDDNEALYGLVSTYGALNNLGIYGENYSLDCSQSDDLCYFNRINFTTFTNQYLHDASTPLIYTMWTEMYAGVRNANSFIAAMDAADGRLDADGAMRAEARFIRAYYYWLLAQQWGNVPLRLSPTANYEDVHCAATPQYEVLKFVVSEMESVMDKITDDLSVSPSRVCRDTAKGILARIYMFMAGATVECDAAAKAGYMKRALDLTGEIIDGGRHTLNPSYSQVFINYIGDIYDTTYRESMWEADFLGDRTSSGYWSNGRIGDLIGLQSAGMIDFENYKCNYSYATYDNTIKLWDLYWTDDRTDTENQLDHVTDTRQDWNLPPYNYAGHQNSTIFLYPYGGNPFDTRDLVAGIDKTPYRINTISTNEDPMFYPASRNCGKFRREVIYEGQKTAKLLFTGINFPILRYSDVLLMYAEAVNEVEGAPTQKAYDCVKAVRDRAGVATRDFSDYSTYAGFTKFVRNERGRELCFEALRKYDLIRWGIFVDEMHKLAEQAEDPRWTINAKSTYAANIGVAVRPKHIVLPIPALELGVNNKLEQHPLWK